MYLGYLGWSAGSFDPKYILSLNPSGTPETGFTDVPLITKCFASRSHGSRNSPQEPSAPLYEPPASTKPAGPGGIPPGGDNRARLRSTSAAKIRVQGYKPTSSLVPEITSTPIVPSTKLGNAGAPFLSGQAIPKVPTTLVTAVKPSPASSSLTPEEIGDDDECEES